MIKIILLAIAIIITIICLVSLIRKFIIIFPYNYLDFKRIKYEFIATVIVWIILILTISKYNIF